MLKRMKNGELTERDIYYIKQKLMGFATILCGLGSAVVTEGDITFLVLALPFGLYIMFTKERVTTE